MSSALLKYKKVSPLEEHLIEYDAKYQSLSTRFDQVDQRLDRIEQLVLSIKSSLDKTSTRD